jgi:cytochrome P450
VSTLSEDGILDPTVVDDPYPYFASLRSAGGIQWNSRYRSWMISSFELVNEGVRGSLFSADRVSPFLQSLLDAPETDTELAQAMQVLNDWMTFKDPPEHTRLRRLVYRAFTPGRVRKMQDDIATTVEELLDALPANGEFDLIRDFAFPLPAIVIAGMLGVPPEDRDKFKSWSGDLASLIFGALEDRGRHARASRGMQDLTAYLKTLIDRFTLEPTDNLISVLVQTDGEDDPLTENEIMATCVLLLFGGHETTTNLIASGVLALLQHPQQRELLTSQPELIGSAVEEILRYDGPAKAVMRVASDEVVMNGHVIRPGQRVFLLIGAANRDPDVFVDPDRFDIGRDPNPHIGFGVGIHYCLGASLARLEGAVAIPAVLRRYPHLAIAADELHWQPLMLNRALEQLPVSATGSVSAR